MSFNVLILPDRLAKRFDFPYNGDCNKCDEGSGDEPGDGSDRYVTDEMFSAIDPADADNGGPEENQNAVYGEEKFPAPWGFPSHRSPIAADAAETQE